MTVPLDARIEEWRSKLLDTSKRNRLISLNLGRADAVKLVYPSAETLWLKLVDQGESVTFPKKLYLAGRSPEEVNDNWDQEFPTPLDGETDEKSLSDRVDLQSCLSSPRLRLDHVLTELMDKQLQSRLSRLDFNAKNSLAEQGVPTLYAVFGLLKWYESPDSQVQVLSPLLLLPAEMERENIDSPWSLKLMEEEVVPNHSLAQLMYSNFAIRLPEIPEQEEDQQEAESGSSRRRYRYYAGIQNAIRHQERWEVLDECVLGIFSFQKIAMWEDLGKNRDQIMEHDLCRAVAGDHSIRVQVPEGMPKAVELDKAAHPTTTYHILDSDSSQHEAIEAAKRGASLVLDGPPGTGKSQTIANIIAEFLAAGKSVLFVSEKSAALEVVKRRLDKRGLGDFCLDCHSHKSKKKQVIDELGRCLNLPYETYQDHTEDLNRLFETRETLNAYVRSLHEVRQPLGLSAFQVQGRHAAFQTGPFTRCPIPDVSTMTQDRLRRIRELLDVLPDCRDAIKDNAHHPWSRIKSQRRSLNLKSDIDHHFEGLDAALERIRAAVTFLCGLDLVPADPDVPTWLGRLEGLKAALSYPLVPAEWFQENPRRVASTYIELDKHTAEYRHCRGGLSEFVEEAVLRLEDDALKTLKSFSPELDLALLPHEHTTVQSFRSHLQNAETPLRTVTDCAKQVNQSLNVGLATLGLKPRPIAARGIGKVQELLGLVRKVTPVRRSWLEPQRRQEIQKIIDRCREEEALNVASRIGLIDRMLPTAFVPESGDSIRRAQVFKSRWKRFLPGWWKLREQLASHYSGTVPETPQLLKDMEVLSEYHRRFAYVNQIKQQYADQLVIRDDGEAEWEQTAEGLRGCEQIDPLLRLYPEVKELMIDPQGVDQQSFEVALGDLRRTYIAFREAVSGLSQYIDVGIVLGIDGNQPKLSLADFIVWLEKRLSLLESQLYGLGTVARLLKPQHDLALVDLPNRVASLETLRIQEDRIEQLSSQIRGLPDRVQVRERDWSDFRDKATWTLHFLDRFSDNPPEPLVRVVTTPEIRQQVNDGFGQNFRARTDDFLTSWEFLGEIFNSKKQVSTGICLDQAPLSMLHEWVRARRQDSHRVHEWVRFCELRDQITQAGQGMILSEVLDGRLSVDHAKQAFLVRFYGLWLDWVYEQDPVLRRFSTEVHERNVDQFRKLDRDAIRRSYMRIRQARLADPTRPTAAKLDAPSSSELGILLREVNKKKRHLPLRLLFSRIPTVLLRLKPCLMMSPLAVSTYLDTREIRFDLVIFDEASQVRPFDAISSMYRGRQLIVAGDQKQLPPTTFFERTASEEEILTDEAEVSDSIADYESILDVCCTLGMPRRRLRWHYRSRREPLIAFSNRHFYDNELVTFPSVLDTGLTPSVRFEYLTNGRWTVGSGGGFNPIEALSTAELVMDHFRNHPESSLGVIAFSQRQQMAILDEVERLRRADSSLEGFFSEDSEEPFFVKNLENVQGDERDVIFLSIGYGPDDSGRVAMRFGPLNRKGGERRLNVAVTRARSSMTVITSMRSHDIDLSRTNSIGVKLLRSYLEFAERGVSALESENTEVDQEGYDSPFEHEVRESLVKHGMEVKNQVGCSGFKIDLALLDPSQPGRFVLGIECDGATYHSSATARDRDRLRQEVLESLGWHIVRIWSTDWMRDPEGQIRRVMEAYERRLNAPSDPTPTLRSNSVDSPVDEVPVATSQSGPRLISIPTATYLKIVDVPTPVIKEMLVSLLETYGVTEQKQLTISVARQLGFQRTGAKIQERIAECVDSLISEKKVLRTDDGALKLNANNDLKLA